MEPPPSGLFDFVAKPSARGIRARRLAAWFGRERNRFSFFVAISLAAHLTLLGFVLGLGPSAWAPRLPSGREKDLALFRKSLAEIGRALPITEKTAQILSTVTIDDVREALEKTPAMDERLSERERAGVYKMLAAQALARFNERTGETSALDVPLAAFFGSPDERPPDIPDADFTLEELRDALSGTARLFRLSREDAQTLESLVVRGERGEEGRDLISVFSKDGISFASRESFYRDCPYAQILAAGPHLFHIVEGFPAILRRGEEAGGRPDAVPARGTDSPRPPRPDAGTPFQVVYMPDLRVAAPPAVHEVRKPALPLTPENEAKILDGLMSFPEDEQVAVFKRDYLDVYDPDSPELSRITRDFIYRNLGMVFTVGEPLSAGFDFLEELFYDNISQNGFIAYACEHPETRTGVEILLCQAAAYEFEARALARIQDGLDTADEVLAGTADPRLRLHNKRAKAFVLRQVFQEMMDELRRRGYSAFDEIERRYRDEQVRIYERLAAMGGEARSRAELAMAGLYWNDGRSDLAIKAWQGIDPAFSSAELDAIRKVLEDGPQAPSLTTRIGAILNGRAVDERNAMLDRLKAFHKWDVRSAWVRGETKPSPAVRTEHEDKKPPGDAK